MPKNTPKNTKTHQTLSNDPTNAKEPAAKIVPHKRDFLVLYFLVKIDETGVKINEKQRAVDPIKPNNPN